MEKRSFDDANPDLYELKETGILNEVFSINYMNTGFYERDEIKKTTKRY